MDLSNFCYDMLIIIFYRMLLIFFCNKLLWFRKGVKSISRFIEKFQTKENGQLRNDCQGVANQLGPLLPYRINPISRLP